MPDDRLSPVLARRLKALRVEGWPGVSITQGQLAQVFDSSTSLLSSWENGKAVPPPTRLTAYATFFATRRSVEGGPYRVLDAAELTAAEAEVREVLLAELRDLAKSDGSVNPGRGFWYFPDSHVITIVAGKLPPEVVPKTVYNDPTSPDYIELNAYADLDSLIELYGHIRSVNPRSVVRHRAADALSRDDYATHLALIGGVDWNTVTRAIITKAEVPVRQEARPDVSAAGWFEVDEQGTTRVFSPVLDGRNLIQDVAHFYRGPNPYNRKRTVTICNGMFARGTLGAVRALTDAEFRDRNEGYLKSRFDGQDAYSVITRVAVENGQALTPDWTLPENVLHEWPEEAGRS